MSGICAVWKKENPGAASAILAALRSGLSVSEIERSAQARDAGAGVAVSARFETQQIYQDESILLACDADLYNEDTLRAEFAGRLKVDAGAQTAALMAAMYRKIGIEFVDRF